jgi:hypothetical protein
MSGFVEVAICGDLPPNFVPDHGSETVFDFHGVLYKARMST